MALGIDPGGAHTGFAVRAGNVVLAHLVVERAEPSAEKGLLQLTRAYLAEVVVVARQLVEVHDVAVLGIEGVTKPNPHVNRRNGNAVIDPGPLLATAVVLGVLLATFPTVLVVAPGKNGALPLLAYPDVLVTSRERAHGLNRVGGGALRHARAAYDVAGAAVLLSRLRASTQARPRADVRAVPAVR